MMRLVGVLVLRGRSRLVPVVMSQLVNKVGFLQFDTSTVKTVAVVRLTTALGDPILARKDFNKILTSLSLV